MTTTVLQPVCNEYTQDVQTYWVYVHPIKGRYALTKDANPRLAVFVTEQSGRITEARSWVLCQLVGHEVTWEELIQIAKRETQGRVAFYNRQGKRFLDSNIA